MQRRTVLLGALLAGVALFAYSCKTAPQASAPAKSQAWWEAAEERAGLRFVHDPGLSGKFYLTEITGSGAALLDADNDGDLDVYLVQGIASAGAGKLFENRMVPDGKLSFRDVTAQSGLNFAATGMGVAAGDYDNDGDLDLYLTAFGSNRLYRNDGNLKFTEVTAVAGADDPRWSTSAAWFDYNADGRLDLVILNYVDFAVAGNKSCLANDGKPDFCNPSVYKPVPAKLLRNEGGGRFKDVTAESGMDRASCPGLGVAVSDFDGDTWPDLFIACDGKPNLLWMNRGGGKFTEEALLRGAAFSEDGMAKAGMGVAAADFDNDGDPDVFVANLTGEGGTLFRNAGGGQFSDISLASSLRQATISRTGFGLRWFDFDHDGLLDLFIANGAVYRNLSRSGEPYPFAESNLLLRNNGAGFDDVSTKAGEAFALEEVSRGAAFGDIDLDGDIDIVVNNNNGPARLLINNVAGGEWLGVALKAATGNPQGYGAVVELLAGGHPLMVRRVGSDQSFLSASSHEPHFAGPQLKRADGIAVLWPNGKRERFAIQGLNRRFELAQGSGQSIAR